MRGSQGSTVAAPVPRIIWTYWHQGINQAPNPVSACIDTLLTQNSGFDVRILDAESVSNWLPEDEIYSLRDYPHFLRADRIRLSLLARYGGIWVDPTVYFRESIEEVVPDVPLDGFFTLINRDPDRIEYWILASHPGSDAIDTIRRRHIAYFRAPRIHKPKGKWRTLQRFLESRLNETHQTAVRWARFPLRYFPAYPYFIFCYIADDVVKRRPHLPSLWESGFYPVADRANELVRESRLKFPVSVERVKTAMTNQTYPLSKLSYHLGNPDFWDLFVRLHNEK